MSLGRPERLAAHHLADDFDCGIGSLDNWLKHDAFAAQRDGTSRTFVTCEQRRVRGYYTLASGAIARADLSGSGYRAHADPIPVAVLGRMAIDRSCQGRGIGRALFRDGALRILQGAPGAGIRGIVVDAISPDSRAFYLALGFDPVPMDAMTLVVTLADLRAAM